MKIRDLYSGLLILLVFVMILAAFYFPYRRQNADDDELLLQFTSEAENKIPRFNSVESEFDYHLTYEWENFNKKNLSVSFSLSKNSLKEAEDEFGYYPNELEEYVNRNLTPLREEEIVHLKNVTQKLIKKSKYSEHFSITEDNPTRFNLRLSAPPSIQKQVRTEFKRITSEIARQQAKYSKKVEKESLIQKKDFLYKKGLRYIEDKIAVNYGLLVKINQERVKPVFQNLIKESSRLNFQQFLSILLSYVQEIRYGIPPLEEKGKYIMGFWVPPKVLINNFGDCDSKGVTFASLWINFKEYPILLIRVPRHLFIGLAIPSFSEEGITINGLRYTLCEVTGPDKLPPGMITPYSRMHMEGGNYSYELIR